MTTMNSKDTSPLKGFFVDNQEAQSFYQQKQLEFE